MAALLLRMHENMELADEQIDCTLRLCQFPAGVDMTKAMQSTVKAMRTHPRDPESQTTACKLFVGLCSPTESQDETLTNAHRANRQAGDERDCT
jgi:hypothetical protein